MFGRPQVLDFGIMLRREFDKAAAIAGNERDYEFAVHGRRHPSHTCESDGIGFFALLVVLNRGHGYFEFLRNAGSG